MSQKILLPIIQKKLYFLADSNPPKDLPNAFYFNIDNDLTYEPFYEDFGPLNLAMIWKYVKEVEKTLFDAEYQKFTFYHFTSPHYKTICNSVLLICAFQVNFYQQKMLCLKKSSEQAFKPFEKLQLRAYRDASYGKCSYKCTILDCLGGLQYAMKLGWFDLKTFNLHEYEHFDQLQNGDLNFIVPQKLVAFSSPTDSISHKSTNETLSSNEYIPIFKKLNIKTVIRLNSPTYDKKTFINHGIQHFDLYFPDGTSPSFQIVENFLQIVENSSGAVAVHCKAGLGRTGCLIASYAMKHYKFPAAFFIGWIRICRPGSILGPQQHFLIESQHYLHQKTESSLIWKQLCQRINPLQLQKITKSTKVQNGRQLRMNQQQLQIKNKGEQGQGKRLMKAKNNNQNKKKNQF